MAPGVRQFRWRRAAARGWFAKGCDFGAIELLRRDRNDSVGIPQIANAKTKRLSGAASGAGAYRAGFTARSPGVGFSARRTTSAGSTHATGPLAARASRAQTFRCGTGDLTALRWVYWRAGRRARVPPARSQSATFPAQRPAVALLIRMKLRRSVATGKAKTLSKNRNSFGGTNVNFSGAGRSGLAALAGS